MEDEEEKGIFQHVGHVTNDEEHRSLTSLRKSYDMQRDYNHTPANSVMSSRDTQSFDGAPRNELPRLNSPTSDRSMNSAHQLTSRHGQEIFDIAEDSYQKEDDSYEESTAQNPGGFRLEEKLLMQQLQAQVDEIKKYPIEYYDIQLYNICKKYSIHLEGKFNAVEWVDTVHHIMKIKQNDMEMDEEDMDLITTNLDRIFDYSSSQLEAYKLLQQIMDLMNALLVKWDIFDMQNYYYRCTGRSLCVKIIDLSDLNKGFMTLDTIWIAIRLGDILHPAVFDLVVFQYREVLLRQLQKITQKILQMNNVDFEANPYIEGFMAWKYIKLQKFGFVPDPYVKVVPYDSLKIPSGLFRWFRKEEEYDILGLKEQLRDFEYLYRTFEKEFIGNMLRFNSKMHIGQSKYN